MRGKNPRPEAGRAAVPELERNALGAPGLPAVTGQGGYRLLARAGTMGKFLLLAFPLVNAEIGKWRALAQNCPDPYLREMALASIATKKFHCQGGSVYSTGAGLRYRRLLVRAIVALQTISDYLDNLCDRMGVEDGAAFARLHQAFLDALRPPSSEAALPRPVPQMASTARATGLPTGTGSFPGGNRRQPPEQADRPGYYSLYPYQDDGGYLPALVRTCQEALIRLPAYPVVQDQALSLARMYCRLQASKHLSPAVREGTLLDWLTPEANRYDSPVFWWEVAAATGSTLGIFALFTLASYPETTRSEAEAVTRAYFPWIGGLHILLDYFIDQAEDVSGGDLNFASYYRNLEETSQRLTLLLEQSLTRARQLPHPFFHELVVQGLLAMYLSDPKVKEQGFQPLAAELILRAGPGCRRLYRTCLALRRARVI